MEEREGEVGEGVRDSMSTCGNHVDTITAVVLEGGTYEKCSFIGGRGGDHNATLRCHNGAFFTH